MSLLRQGLDILSAQLGLKRGRADREGAAPSASQASRGAASASTEAAALGLGRCSLHTDGSSEGGSALKRCRVSTADPSAAATAPPGFACKANPLFVSFANPLFQDEDEDEDADEFELAGCSSHDELRENAGYLGNLPRSSSPPALLPRSCAGLLGAQGRSLAWGSPPAALCGGSSEGFAAESGGSAALLGAFCRQLQSPLVLSALYWLERKHRHPLGTDGADFFDSLEGTCAGLLLLCLRARLGSEELSQEVLLTLLWLLESCESQYRSDLSTCLTSYLCFHPGRYLLREGLQRSMLELQVQLLERCNWRVVLRDCAELQAALELLESEASFTQLCDHIADCAMRRVLPMGSLPADRELQSPDAAQAVSQAVAAAQGCSLSGEVGCSSDSEPSPLISASEAAAAGLGGEGLVLQAAAAEVGVPAAAAPQLGSWAKLGRGGAPEQT